MRIDIDLDDDRIISSPGVKSPVTLLQFKRDTSAEIQVRFWTGTLQTQLPAGATGKFGVKPTGEYDTTPLVSALDWTLTGAAETAVYTFTPDFNGATLAALLGSGDGDTENDQDNVTGILEIFWLADGKKHRSQTVNVVIENDVVKDADLTPSPAPTPIGTSEPVNMWTPCESDRQWNSIASSSTGGKLVATVYNGQIFTSVNYGVTWTPRESVRQWNSVASSTDGTKLVATVYGGQIFTSTDSGATWSPRDSARYWSDVASSDTGTKLVAVVASGQIFTSTDSGATWTPRDSARNWNDVASSGDGTKLVATVYGGQIFTSTDSGANWTPRESVRNWKGVASSSDGTKLVATVNYGQIFTSTDSGATWTPRATSRQWTDVASSSNGTILLAGTFNDDVYTSQDTGATWQPRGLPARSILGVAISSTGAGLMVAAGGAQIYLADLSGETTAAPPYLAAHGGYLYVQESGIWKRTAIANF